MSRLLLFFIFIYAFCSCSNEQNALDAALDFAGDNRQELQKVLDHYKDNSLKYKAARFLIENMPSKYAIMPLSSNMHIKVLKAIKKEDPISWEMSHSLISAALDSIARTDFNQGINIVYDIKVIKSEYLIENIDLAFKMWENNGMKKYYTFYDFCNYILPYRVGHEPLSRWRNIALNRYGNLLDSLKNPVDIARNIAMQHQVRYNIGMSKYPYVLSYKELDDIRWGTCYDMSSFLAMSLRALGIASATDYVKAWANRSSSHCWNVVKDTTGHFVDVGYGAQGNNSVVYKISKIYRNLYQKPFEKDVTNEYDMPLSNIELKIKGKNNQVYLCTFNNSHWVPIAISLQKDEKVIFKNIGRGILWGYNRPDGYRDEGKGIVYLPTIKKEEALIQIVYPFILTEDGDIRVLHPTLGNTEEVTLFRKYPKYNNIPIDVHDSNEIASGDIYELFFWDKEWCSLGRKVADKNTLVFYNVPKNSLLWLHNLTRGKEERIFTYENQKQIWW